MLFAPPPTPPCEPIATVHVAPLPTGFHNDRLLNASPSLWTLKGNPQHLLDDQAFHLIQKTAKP